MIRSKAVNKTCATVHILSTMGWYQTLRKLSCMYICTAQAWEWNHLISTTELCLYSTYLPAYYTQVSIIVFYIYLGTYVYEYQSTSGRSKVRMYNRQDNPCTLGNRHCGTDYNTPASCQATTILHVSYDSHQKEAKARPSSRSFLPSFITNHYLRFPRMFNIARQVDTSLLRR